MSCNILTNLPSGAIESPYLLESASKSFTKIDPLNWQDTLPRLGIFDVILLHHSLPQVKEDTNLILDSGKATVEQVKEICPQLFHVRYSDQDLNSFFEQCKGNADQKHLSRFLSELCNTHQISEEQYQKVAEKYQLDKSIVPKLPSDPLFPLIQECLLNHMKKGSKVICVLRPPHSKYEDPQFFEHIITNSSLDYQEKASAEETLILIEKLS